MNCDKEYIKMCDCEEIQKLWNVKEGDFYMHYKHNKVIIVDETANKLGDFNCSCCVRVWLPRQDQLSDMIDTWNKKYSVTFFQNIVSNSEYRGIPKQGFNSIEKHLLAFVMTEKFSKIWLNNKQKWVKQ